MHVLRRTSRVPRKKERQKPGGKTHVIEICRVYG